MVIIPVTGEVSFHGSLFKTMTLTLELFNVIVKPWDLWTINHSPCFQRAKLIQYVSKGLVKAVGECTYVVAVYACTKKKRRIIVFMSFFFDFVNVRVCYLHNAHRTGHFENYKQHTAYLQLVALFP